MMTNTTGGDTLRFVLLHHLLPESSARRSHFDFMIEGQDDLRTWSLATLPREGASTFAEEIAGHRKMYLDYEGPLSDDRGSVSRVDQGSYEMITCDDSIWEGELRGRVYRGTFRFVRSSATGIWQLSYTSSSR